MTKISGQLHSSQAYYHADIYEKENKIKLNLEDSDDRKILFEFILKNRESIGNILSKSKYSNNGNIDWISFLSEQKEKKGILFVSLDDMINHITYLTIFGEDNNYDDLIKISSQKRINEKTSDSIDQDQLNLLIGNQGANLGQALKEAVSNGIDASIEDKKIGKFGEGFYQLLRFIKGGEGVLEVLTNDGKSSHKVIFKEENGKTMVGTMKTKKEDMGTEIKLTKKITKKEQEDLKKYLIDGFETNKDINIILNGKQINTLSGYFHKNGKEIELGDKFIKIDITDDGFSVIDNGTGMNTQVISEYLLLPKNNNKPKVEVKDEDLDEFCEKEVGFFWKNGNTGKTNIKLQVAGVKIENFVVENTCGMDSFILELPSFTDLENSRNKVNLTKEVIISLKVMMEKIKTFDNIQDKVRLFEIVGEIVEKLSDRKSSNTIEKKYDLDILLKEGFEEVKKEIETSGKIVLPGNKELKNILGNRENIVFVGEKFVETDLEKIPGIEKIIDVKNEKIPFYAVNFDEKAEYDYLVTEKGVLISKKFLEQKEDLDKIVAILNVSVNIEVGYELGIDKKENKGRILIEGGEVKIGKKGNKDENKEGINIDINGNITLVEKVKETIEKPIEENDFLRNRVEQLCIDNKFLQYLPDFKTKMRDFKYKELVSDDISDKEILFYLVTPYNWTFPFNNYLDDFINNYINFVSNYDLETVKMLYSFINCFSYTFYGINKNEQEIMLNFFEYTKKLGKNKSLADIITEYISLKKDVNIIEKTDEEIQNMEMSSLINLFEKELFSYSSKYKYFLFRKIKNELFGEKKGNLKFGINQNIETKSFIYGNVSLENEIKYYKIDKATFNIIELDETDFSQLSKSDFSQLFESNKNKILSLLTMDVHHSFSEEVGRIKLQEEFDLYDYKKDYYSNILLETNDLPKEKTYLDEYIEFGTVPLKSKLDLYEKNNNNNHIIPRLNIENDLYFEFFDEVDVNPAVRIFAKLLKNGGEFLENKELLNLDIKESFNFLLSELIGVNKILNGKESNYKNLSFQDKINYLRLLNPNMSLIFREVFSTIEGQDKSTMIWIRELVQNSIDVINKSGANKKIDFDFYSNNEGNFVTKIKDEGGMNLEEVKEYLLNPGKSSKIVGEGLGMFGKGFFTIFPGAKEVNIKTSKGDGKVVYIKAVPIYKGGSIVDLDIKINEVEEDYKGTEIERVDIMDGIEGNMEAMFGVHNIVKYVGNVEGIDINYNGEKINKPKEIIGEQEVEGMGKLGIYKSKDNIERLTRGNLYISEIKDEYLNFLPKWVIDYVKKQKLSIDLPEKTQLTGSRNVIIDLPILIEEFRPVIFNIIIDYILKEYIKGNLWIEMLGLDYFSNSNFELLKSNEISNIAHKNNDGLNLSKEEIGQLKDDEKFAQFLVQINFELDGKKTSLQKIKLKKQKVGSGYTGKYIDHGIEKQLIKGESKVVSKKSIEKEIDKDKLEKFEKFLFENFEQLHRKLFEKELKIHYFEEEGTSAHARSDGEIGIEKKTLIRWVNGYENVGIFQEIISTVTHEFSHLMEYKYSPDKAGTHENSSHSESFLTYNKIVLREFLRMHLKK